MAIAESATVDRSPDPAEVRRVLWASCVGSVLEAYDFGAFAAIPAIVSAQFLSQFDPSTAFILTLILFAVGFAIRPLGSLIFGRLGDLIGRRKVMVVTIVMMGLATFFIGCLPNYATIGVTAPIILIVLRLIQGLSLGGEYGNALTLLGEFSPPNRRGLYAALIDYAAPVSYLIIMVVVLLCRQAFGAEFDTWGWRVPFLLSIIVAGFALWIRLKVSESPVFQQMKAEGRGSSAPLTDALMRPANLKRIVIGLFGMLSGQAVVYFTGTFYILFFLGQTLKVDPATVNMLIATALLISLPSFAFCGWLSDRIGRKPVIMAGCILAAVSYFPLFHALQHFANPDQEAATMASPVVIIADPATCAFQFNPTGTARFTSPCDRVKSYLVGIGVPYSNQAAAPGTALAVTVGATRIDSDDTKAIGEAAAKAGYPAKADPAKLNIPMVVLILTIFAVFAAMVYPPSSIALVELYPANVRSSSVSIVYNIGNGWFGGLMPATAFSLVALTGNLFYGLWYPVVIAGATAVIGILFLPETKHADLTK